MLSRRLWRLTSQRWRKSWRRRSRSGRRMRLGRWPNARWPADWTGGRRATATRWWCTWTVARCVGRSAGRSRGDVSGCGGTSRAATVRTFTRERWPEGRQDDFAGRCSHVRRTSSEVAAEPAASSQTVLDEAGGIHVSAETARRLACDAAKVEMQHGPRRRDSGRWPQDGGPSRRRCGGPWRRATGGAAFPAVGNRRCDAHHVRHWADGGETALDNLVLLCRRHHRAVHEEGFRITLDASG